MAERIEGTLTEAGSTESIVSTGEGMLFAAWGTFSTATAKVEMQVGDTQWQDVPTSLLDQLTSAGNAIAAPFPPNIRVRVTLVGGVSPSVNYLLQA